MAFFVGNSSNMEPIYDEIHMSLTILSTVIYSLLFLSAYVQLWLIYFLKHKLISTQSINFFLCCLFTGLRIILFSFFYRNIKTSENFQDFTYWFFMCLPIVIQYLIVLHITVFYYKTYVKSLGESSKLSRKMYIVIGTAIALQLVMSILPIWFPSCSSNQNQFSAMHVIMTCIHVITTDLIFLATISTFVYVYTRFPKFPNAVLIQEAKRITRVRSIIVSATCLIGVIAKMSYDIIALFGCSNNNKFRLPSTLQQSDFVRLKEDISSFVAFGIILFLWEVIPLVAMIILLRVQFPSGYFKKLGFVRNTRHSIGSNPKSHTNSMNSNGADPSRYIQIPNYGSAYYSQNQFNGGPSSSQVGQVSPSTLSSYDTRTFASGQLRTPGTSNNYMIQQDNLRKIYLKNKGTRSIVPRIWRSVSHKVSSQNNVRDHCYDPRLGNNARLPTANEE